MTRILLIEDNRDLAYGLRNNLEIEEYDVEVAHDGVAGLRMFSKVKPDLTILDIMLLPVISSPCERRAIESSLEKMFDHSAASSYPFAKFRSTLE